MWKSLRRTLKLTSCSTYHFYSQMKEVPLLHGKVKQYPNGNSTQHSNVLIKIDMPQPFYEERYPTEKWKTFLSFLLLVFSFILTTVSLSITHDRLPDRAIYGPLPDIVLDNVTAQDWALDISEIMIMIVLYSSILIIIFHKYRFIVLRRLCQLISILYLMRAITMFVTVLPPPSKTYFCSPKANETSVYLVAKRSIKLIAGMGLSINGQHVYCGDYIFSGHTVMLVLGYLVISEYTPKRLFVLHWLAWINAIIGVVMLMLAHGHYTIDVITAYYVTTRLFWTYHGIINSNSYTTQHRTYNKYLTRDFWFPLLQYFERNVRGPLPKQFEWPLPWPKCSSSITTLTSNASPSFQSYNTIRDI